MAEEQSPSALNRGWLVGRRRRFFDEGEEYEVMRVGGRKRWNKSAIDGSLGNETFFCVVTPSPGTFMGGAAESRLTQLHEGTPDLAWWRDRAVRRKSTSRASATGPVSRRATRGGWSR